MRLDVGDELVFGRVRDVVAEGLGEELVGRGEILLAVPEQHAGPAVEGRPGRLGDQRGLAQPGLARDEQHLAPLARGDPLGRVRHRRRLGLAADHTHPGRTARRPGNGHRVRSRSHRGAPRRTSTVSTGSGKSLQLQTARR